MTVKCFGCLVLPVGENYVFGVKLLIESVPGCLEFPLEVLLDVRSCLVGHLTTDGLAHSLYHIVYGCVAYFGVGQFLYIHK